jgi:hypothetical protein
MEIHARCITQTVELGGHLVAARGDKAWIDLISQDVTIWVLFLSTSRPDALFHTDGLVLRKMQTNGDSFERIGLLDQNEMGTVNALEGPPHEISSA